MRVLIAGATGAVGSRLVPLLVAAGRKVTGPARSPAKAELLSQAGATPAVVDAFDKAAVRAAVLAAGPEAVVPPRSGVGWWSKRHGRNARGRRHRSATSVRRSTI